MEMTEKEMVKSFKEWLKKWKNKDILAVKEGHIFIATADLEWLKEKQEQKKK